MCEDEMMAQATNLRAPQNGKPILLKPHASPTFKHTTITTATYETRGWHTTTTRNLCTPAIFLYQFTLPYLNYLHKYGQSSRH